MELNYNRRLIPDAAWKARIGVNIIYISHGWGTWDIWFFQLSEKGLNKFACSEENMKRQANNGSLQNMQTEMLNGIFKSPQMWQESSMSLKEHTK